MASWGDHPESCYCWRCCEVDSNEHILKTLGQDALDRINADTMGVKEFDTAVPTRKLKAGQRVGRGVVRTISEGQKKFLRSLLTTRDTSKVTILPGQTLDPNEIDTMGVKGATALIEKLIQAPVISVRMATDGQKKYITSLNSNIRDINCRISEADIDSITFAEVNDTIALLKRIADGERQDDANNKTARPAITEGAYWHNGKIARVQRTKDKKRLYATVQVEPNVNEFEYAPGLINKLDPARRLTLEEMKAFAAEYHACGDCGRRLTNKLSIEYGIGPICRNKGYF